MISNVNARRPWYAPAAIFASTVTGLFRAVFARRLGWLAILLPFLVVIAAVIIIGASSGVLAPFLYPLF